GVTELVRGEPEHGVRDREGQHRPGPVPGAVGAEVGRRAGMAVEVDAGHRGLLGWGGRGDARHARGPLAGPAMALPRMWTERCWGGSTAPPDDRGGALGDGRARSCSPRPATYPAPMTDRGITMTESADSTSTTRERRIATAAAALARHADPGPTALGSLTDEQLVVLHGAGDPPALITPWRDRAAGSDGDRELMPSDAARGGHARCGGERPSAGGAAARTLASVEGREPVGDPDDLLPAALPAGIVGRRVYSRRRVTLTDLDDPARGAVQAFADLDGSVMQEQISANGIHHFTMSTADSAARVQALWMLGDPELDGAPVGETAPEVRSGTFEELLADRDLGAILASPVRRVQVLVEDRAEGERRMLWVVHDGSSPVALQPADPTSEDQSLELSVLDAVRVGRDDLRAQLVEFLSAD